MSKVKMHKAVCDRLKNSIEQKTSLTEMINWGYENVKTAKLRKESSRNYVVALSSLANMAIEAICEEQQKELSEVFHKMNDTYARKNKDYGDSFAQMRKQFDNAILIRLYDKCSRLNTLLSGNVAEVKDESIIDTLYDLANYCIMEIVEVEIDEGVDQIEYSETCTDSGLRRYHQ
jgi:hypothetical protein